MNTKFAGCFTLIMMLTAAANDEFQPTPPTSVSELPHRAWDGKNEPKMDGPFAEAAVRLFNAGLPDPAELPYHKITIPTGNCYTGDDGLMVTHGWMLPAKANMQRFAIAWNGLVYPVLKDYGKADFNTDAQTIHDKSEEVAGSYLFANGEARDVSYEMPSPMHGIYLTRLGRSDVAKQLLAHQEDLPKDLTPMLADHWAWNHYDRAVCAHMRGDPRLAFASLRDLERIRPALESFLHPDDKNARQPLAWANQFDHLKKECERRIAVGKIGAFNEGKFANAKRDAAELIDAVDRIQVPQNGQPGDVIFYESPIIKALVEIGNDAVEPLLQCLAHDTRLTQSTHFWRSHYKGRTVLGVHEAALYALESILHASYFQLASTGDSLTGRGAEQRAKLAAIIRTDWERHGKTSGAERAYAILNDNEAGSDRWLDAALSLLHPDRYHEETGELIKPNGPLPGEPLRDRMNPSVSELLVQRIDDIVGAKRVTDYEKQIDSYAQIDILRVLAEWDPPQARSRIDSQVKEWLKNDAWEREPLRGIFVLIEDTVPEVPELWPLFKRIIWTKGSGDDVGGDYGKFITRVILRNTTSKEMQDATKGLWT